MAIDYAELKAGDGQIARALADARSVRNLSTRRKRQDEREERVAEGARRRRKALSDREADAFLKRRLRIKVPEADRPRSGSRTPRRLFTRTVAGMLKGTTGLTDARGPDGRHAIHYSFTARGFGSRKGRRWRAGEAERAALYSVREEALEDGERGWWSNIAADRNELVAHYRASEALEKHDRANANVYIVEVIALPAELSAEQRRQAARRVCRGLEKRGLAYTVGIHLPDAAGDQRNYHLHLIYSMRACRRVAAYEWDFATAKHTEINTRVGIVQRRCGVVVAINETLRDAGIAKRYTPLSNRERGMAPPTRGKVGQVETALGRRLAAAEDRQARLAALQAHTRWLRQTMLDAAARLEAARRKVIRRLVETSIALGHDEAERIVPAERRATVRIALEHAYAIVDRTTAAADERLVSARRAVRDRLRSTAAEIRTPMERHVRDEHRAGVIARLNAVAVHASDTVRRVRADLDQRRTRVPVIEESPFEGESGHDDMKPGLAAPDVAAATLSAAITTAQREKAEQAASRIARQMVDKALASLKRKGAVIRRGDSGLFVADTAGLLIAERRVLEQRMADPSVQQAMAELYARQIADLPFTPGKLTTAELGRVQHDRPISNKPGHDHHGKTIYKAVPRRFTGLRPPTGLAGLRVLRGIGVDDRSADAAGLLPDVRRTDVRRASAVHLEVRGAPPDRLTDALDLSGATAPPTERHEPGHSDPLPRRGLWAQAEDVVRSDERRPAKAKGRDDDVDEATCVTSRAEHER